MNNEEIASTEIDVRDLLKKRDISGVDSLTLEENNKVNDFLYKASITDNEEIIVGERLDLSILPIFKCHRESYIQILEDRLNGVERPSNVYRGEIRQNRVLL